VLVLGHGAGAGHTHPWMIRAADGLAGRGVRVVTFDFPYIEAGRRVPDRGPDLERAFESAWQSARASGPMFAGGKSMGGRMTSRAAAAAPLEGVAGLVFLGFPLHPAGQPGVSRADHLSKVSVPMLFLQGTRDALADLALLEPVVGRLGARATLRVIEHADHMFHVLKRSGRTDEQVLDELAAAAAGWIEERT
jgi:hypothetical protein